MNGDTAQLAGFSGPHSVEPSLTGRMVTRGWHVALFLPRGPEWQRGLFDVAA